MMMLYRLILALLIVGVLALIPVGTAFAQADPDSAPTADIYCYRNLLETDDCLVFIYANIPYASLPDDPVTAAFIWRLIGTDNTTELGSTTGYSYNDSGYGYNVYSMYFAASDNFTWGSAYTIRLSGNPAVFDTPPVYNFPIVSNDWSTMTTQADNRDELEARILITADDLYTLWGLTSTTRLTDEEETGTYLSTTGEAFFRGAIYGLQAMAPGVFDVVAGEITATDRTWSENYTSSLAGQYTGTWVETSQAAGADLFNASYDLTSVILTLIVCIAIFFGNIVISRNHWSALIDVAMIAIIIGKIGLYEATFLGLVAALCWLYSSAKTWGVIT